jgi:hypothetical protein
MLIVCLHLQGKSDEWQRAWALKPSMAYELFMSLANVMKVSTVASKQGFDICWCLERCSGRCWFTDDMYRNGAWLPVASVNRLVNNNNSCVLWLYIRVVLLLCVCCRG